MRRTVFLVLLVVLLSAWSGGLGIEPTSRAAPTVPPPSITILGPTATPRLELTTDPVAIPSTTALPAESDSAIPSVTVPTSEGPFPARPTVIPRGVEPAEGTVALTFDDGPFDGYTDTILDVLAAHRVTATFFIATYRLPRVAHLIPEMVAAGHSVQSHSDHHDDLTEMSEEEIRIELSTSIDKLVDAGAARPTCVRPPYGTTSDLVNRVAGELGLEVVGWTLNTLDYSLQDAERVIDTTLDHIQPGDTVLMHDQWAPIWETALPVVITALDARGVGFSPICVEAPRE